MKWIRIAAFILFAISVFNIIIQLLNGIVDIILKGGSGNGKISAFSAGVGLVSSILALIVMALPAPASPSTGLNSPTTSPAREKEEFDVFLCHNSKDKPAVKRLENN